MRCTAIIALAMGVLLSLSGCGTDNPPVVHPAPPFVGAPAPTATPATMAWADKAVTDALAAEKAARDAGGTNDAISQAIMHSINSDMVPLEAEGFEQMQAGLTLAVNSSRNTTATHDAFVAAFAMLPQAAPAGTGGGHCTGCKGSE